MSEEEIIKKLDIVFMCLESIRNVEEADEYRKLYVQLKNLYQKEKEKNKELDRENQGLFEAYNFNDTNLLAKILKDYRKEMKNSISKDKIKAKIEELEKRQVLHSRYGEIKVLQELLEEED